MKQTTKEDIGYQDTPNHPHLLPTPPSSIGEFLFTPNTSLTPLIFSLSTPIISQTPNKRIGQNSHNNNTSDVLIVCYNVLQIIGAITICLSIKISQYKF